MRRLKTHSIRINYHARKCKKWGNQCRAHLFVSSSILNRAGHEATTDLADIRNQQVSLAKRRDRLRIKRQQLNAIAEEIHRAAEDVAALYAKLQLPTIRRGTAAVMARRVASAAEGDSSASRPPTLSVESAEAILLIEGLRSAVPELEEFAPALIEHFATIL